jgi:hypothetical protein
MALDQLPQFMHALGSVESGNRYTAVGPYTGSTYGRARGRYQIMETIYPGWAREAGVNPNDFSPEAQDRVASHKMRQYYNKYGSWELVAVAWFAGPGRANRAMERGVSSLAGIRDMLGTDVPKYVEKVMKAMGRAPKDGGQVPAQASTQAGGERPLPEQAQAPVAEVEEEPDEDTFATDRQNMSNLMASIMAFVSERASKAGGRILNLQEMFGEPGVDEPLDEDDVPANLPPPVTPDPMRQPAPDPRGQVPNVLATGQQEAV